MGNTLYEIKRNMNRAVDRYEKASLKYLSEEVNIAVKKLKREAEKMYDQFIDQFYKYRTTSYYRHDVGKGTGTGMNLYRAQDFKINKFMYEDYELSELIINFNSEDMAEYKGKYRDGDEKKNVDRQFVLDLVLDGTRGLPNGWGQSWEGSYDGDYFEYEGIMRDAFNKFISKESSMIVKMCRKKVNNKIKEIESNANDTINRNMVNMLNEVMKIKIKGR